MTQIVDSLYEGSEIFVTRIDDSWVDDSSGFADAIVSMEKIVRKILSPVRCVFQSRPIVERILEEHGRLLVSEIASEHEISERQCGRIFNREIGMPVKLLSRIVRFNFARKMLEQRPDADIAWVSYEAGYTDQAHFNKNFREMLNMTPFEFKKFIKRRAEHRSEMPV
ncbi:MAG: AraC family transcriptional regulator [Bacteroidetes bacterium]|nr:AraC family transcriptional regulator [Bacteroidota bacterium]